MGGGSRQVLKDSLLLFNALVPVPGLQRTLVWSSANSFLGLADFDNGGLGPPVMFELSTNNGLCFCVYPT